jgi:hypothetical protein
MQRTLLIVVLAAFSALTARALYVHGLWGLFEPLLTTWAGLQVLVDLAIALSLFVVWMWRDAQASGRNPWPWLVLTLAAGSIGPLLYLVTTTKTAGASSLAKA